MRDRALESLVVVVPGLDEAENLPVLHAALKKVLGTGGWKLTILFVDDGSTDGTDVICRQLNQEDASFQYITLSRNFGHQRALTAGLDHAEGDVVVIMDADLQDPPEVVLQMVEKWRQGADVVFGRRISREGETLFKKLSACLFYRVMRWMSGMDIPSDTGDFRLMDRAVVRHLKSLREQSRFMRGLVHWIGFRQEAVEYNRPVRKLGLTKYPFRKMLSFAWDGITSFSWIPLRLAMWVGFSVFIFAAFLGLYYLVRKIFWDDLLPGWTALFLAVTSFGGLQMFFIGLLGEYIGRIFDETKKRPLYLIKSKSFSLSPEEERNR